MTNKEGKKKVDQYFLIILTDVYIRISERCMENLLHSSGFPPRFLSPSTSLIFSCGWAESGLRHEARWIEAPPSQPPSTDHVWLEPLSWCLDVLPISWHSIQRLLFG